MSIFVRDLFVRDIPWSENIMHAYYDIENLNENHQALFWAEIPASYEANNFFYKRTI